MAKAKYKLGTMIQVTTEEGSEHGIVKAIVTSENGHQYSFASDDFSELIDEESVTGAFREVVARKPKAQKKGKRKHAEDQQAA